MTIDLAEVQSDLASTWGGRVRLARYDAFVQTTDEFGVLPHLRRYFGDLASRLRERWVGAADVLPLFPAFAAGERE